MTRRDLLRALPAAGALTLASRAGEERSPREDLLVYRGPDGKPRPVRTIEDWQRRRAEIVRAFESVVGKLPGPERKCPLDVRTTEEADCGEYVRKAITYASEPNGRAPAFLLVPKAATEATPARAVLALHPTEDRIGNAAIVGLGTTRYPAYAAELASRGVVVLAPSYPLLARYQPDLKALGWESGTLKAVWDNLRGLDLLDGLPYVKPGPRGAIGHSLGGHNAVFTSVIDDRIDAVVTSCGLDAFPDYYRGAEAVWRAGAGWTQTRYMPRLAGFRGRLKEIPFDFPELIGALAPRRVMIIAPLHDDNFRAESVDRVVAAARPVFALYGKADHLVLEHPDCTHDFPPAMREKAYRFLSS
jgi:hypothetical protein